VSVRCSGSPTGRPRCHNRASQANDIDGTGRRFASTVAIGCGVASGVSIGGRETGCITGRLPLRVARGESSGQSGRRAELPEASRATGPDR
jgi:hypothetical protein